ASSAAWWGRGWTPRNRCATWPAPSLAGTVTRARGAPSGGSACKRCPEGRTLPAGQDFFGVEHRRIPRPTQGFPRWRRLHARRTLGSGWWELREELREKRPPPGPSYSTLPRGRPFGFQDSPRLDRPGANGSPVMSVVRGRRTARGG